MSFLDGICCGFGAIILLLVLTKIGEPRALEESRIHLEALVARLQQKLFEIRSETNVLNRELITKQERLSEKRVKGAPRTGLPSPRTHLGFWRDPLLSTPLFIFSSGVKPTEHLWLTIGFNDWFKQRADEPLSNNLWRFSDMQDRLSREHP